MNNALLKAFPPGWKAESGRSYFTLHHSESDGSRLTFDPLHGTILDPSLPREFEYVVYERDVSGYLAICGQISDWKDAIAFLFNLAGLSIDTPPEFHGSLMTQA